MEAYEGTVAEVNEPLLYFRFADGVYVNVAISFAQNYTHEFSITLPSIGRRICCRNLHRKRGLLNGCPVYVMCRKSSPRFSSETLEGAQFLYVIQKECFGISDVFEVMKYHENLRKRYEDIANIILWYLGDNTVVFSKKNKEYTCCEFNNLPKIEFSTISYLDAFKVSAKMPKNCIWSFVQYRAEVCEVLIGSLHINPDNGTIFFKDKLREIACIFHQSQNYAKNKYKYFENTLCIRKFRIINEFYRNQTTLSYLYFETQFVDIYRAGMRKPEVIPTNFSMSICFYILKKSHMCYTGTAGAHFWMLVQLKRTAECGFIRFSSKLLHKFYLNAEYTVHFNGHLRPIYDVAYARFDANITQYEMPSQAVITLEKEWKKPCPISILTKSNVGKKTCFRALLKKRIFGEKVRDSRHPGFGHINHNQRLIFEIRDSHDVLKLDFENWNNIETPIGLIENALIDVRNVDFVSKTNCKTNVFTTFDIVTFL